MCYNFCIPIGNDAQSFLFTRWGRVGADGQTQIKGPFAAATAVAEFKKQFKAKAAVAWEDRVGMVAKKGKYTWLERDYGDDDEEKADDKAEGGSDSKKKEKAAPTPDSTLKTEVQELCRLIFSTTIIDATLSSMNYDANKLPLGKLAKGTILKGFAALKTLSEVIENPNGDAAKEYSNFNQACEQLSSTYYSIIPHDFGRNRPHAINSEALLKKELELVDALGDMVDSPRPCLITTPMVTRSTRWTRTSSPWVLSSMEPIERASNEFSVLETYVRETHGHTHGHIKANVLNAYRVERAGETEAWKKAGYDNMADGERLLLWHGSRSTNFAGILKQGLRIAPPEAPVTGYMFGKGVYFADMMSKSAGYCYPGQVAYMLSNNAGLLLLCEVAAKPFYELCTAEYDADRGCKTNKKKATKGLGRTQPGKWKDAGKALENAELVGCHMPDGPGQDTPIPAGGYLQYNEYIVYDVSQIRLRYLLMVKM
ncbi:PARP-domain-containing protein [Mycena latifolia]|nr:PARP-domain-containing protein [Mycena latifolia]